MGEGTVWAILFAPLTAFLLIALIIRPFFNSHSRLAGYITITAVLSSFILSLWALQATINETATVEGGPSSIHNLASHAWLTVGAFELRVGILMDSLTAVMLVVISGVSLLVQIYSQGYMRGDPGYARYYALMSLFTASMLGLVMASSILQLFVFWELVGLCSYLLIGFWYNRPAAARAAVKAFCVTRLGDFGLLLAIMYLFLHQSAFSAQGLNPLEIADIHKAAHGGIALGVIGTTAATWLGIGIFAGAAGKSAQVPLHVWLPDAMEGPTPVSALIHSATMVTAGVFLVARFFPLFEASSTVMNLVAIIGGFTAIFAATMGLVVYDIKRVIAYSTISQLGYMMLALGIGAYPVAIFHLFTHAFFKALLFLCAGSVNHATGTFDMRYMGGLRRVQPWTYWTFVLAAVSLAGVFPLAGFWSKDEILAAAFSAGSLGSLLGILGLATAFITALYIFRVLFMTFHGQFRGGITAEQRNISAASQKGDIGGSSPYPSLELSHTPPNDHGDKQIGQSGGVHLAESPWVMVLPLIVLAVLSVVAGIIVNPPVHVGPVPEYWMTRFLVPPFHETHAAQFNLVIAILSTAVAVAGILTAWAIYGSRLIAPERVTIKPLRTLIYRKYYIDELYEGLIVNRAFYRAACGFLNWFDMRLIDEIVDRIGWLGRNTGKGMSFLQTGQLQTYGAVMTMGVGAIIAVYFVYFAVR
jgi:NADH-quinone oxidoreductase subunit L